MSIFEKASRKKLRWITPVGTLSVEDLWDLPLTNPNGVSLDSIAVACHEAIGEDKTKSFVKATSTADTTSKLRFDIVKHIIDVRLEEQDKAAKASETRAKKQKLMEVIARKQDASLEEMGIDDLQKMVDEL